MRHRSRVVQALAIALACAPLAAVAQPATTHIGWRSLFNGTTLDGWHQCNGSAPYTVENGTITGRSVVGSPNSFLCTRDRFAGFQVIACARHCLRHGRFRHHQSLPRA